MAGRCFPILAKRSLKVSVMPDLEQFPIKDRCRASARSSPVARTYAGQPCGTPTRGTFTPVRRIPLAATRRKWLAAMSSS